VTSLTSASPFRTLLRGRFRRHQVRVQWQGDEVGPSHSFRKAVDAHWQRLLAARPGAALYDGRLCRLVAFRVDGDILTLTLGWTRYRDLLYSNEHASDLIAAGKQESLSRALGVSAVVRTADRSVVLLQRSQAVGEAPGLLDVVGGHMELRRGGVSASLDPFRSVAEEVTEELNVPCERLRDWCCLGLIETVATLKPELVFAVTFEGTSANISESCTRARDRFEFEDIRFVAEDRLQSFVLHHQDQISPSAVGALQLFCDSTFHT